MCSKVSPLSLLLVILDRKLSFCRACGDGKSAQNLDQTCDVGIHGIRVSQSENKAFMQAVFSIVL